MSPWYKHEWQQHQDTMYLFPFVKHCSPANVWWKGIKYINNMVSMCLIPFHFPVPAIIMSCPPLSSLHCVGSSWATDANIRVTVTVSACIQERLHLSSVLSSKINNRQLRLILWLQNVKSNFHSSAIVNLICSCSPSSHKPYWHSSEKQSSIGMNGILQ